MGLISVVVRVGNIDATADATAAEVQHIKDDRVKTYLQHDTRFQSMERSQAEMGRDIKEILSRLPRK